MTYKRYLVFNYSSYYAAGGSKDVIGSYDTLEDVKSVVKQLYENSEVLDLEERKWILE